MIITKSLSCKRRAFSFARSAAAADICVVDRILCIRLRLLWREKSIEKLFFAVKMFDLFFFVCYHCNNYYKNKLTHACVIEKMN